MSVGGAQYYAGVDAAATGTSLKTILQITAGSQDQARINEIGISFDGTSSTAVPVLVQVRRQTSAGTTAALATNFGPNALDSNDGTNTATLKQVATVEPTAGVILRSWRVSPTSGLVIQFPMGQEIVVPKSGIVAICVTAAATVNADAYLIWSE